MSYYALIHWTCTARAAWLDGRVFRSIIGCLYCKMGGPHFPLRFLSTAFKDICLARTILLCNNLNQTEENKTVNEWIHTQSEQSLDRAHLLHEHLLQFSIPSEWVVTCYWSSRSSGRCRRSHRCSSHRTCPGQCTVLVSFFFFLFEWGHTLSWQALSPPSQVQVQPERSTMSAVRDSSSATRRSRGLGWGAAKDMEERVTRRAEVKMAEKCILTVWWLVSWIEVLKVGWFGIDLVCSDSNVVADDEKDVWEDLEGVFMSFRLSSNFLF